MKTQSSRNHRHVAYMLPGEDVDSIKVRADMIERQNAIEASRAKNARRSKCGKSSKEFNAHKLPSAIQQRIKAVVARARSQGTLGPTVE